MCKVCKIDKPLTEMVKHSKSPGGYRLLCKLCKRLDSKEDYKQYGRNYNPEVAPRYYQNNKEKIRRKQKTYYQNNTHIFRENAMARRAGIEKATPKWVDRKELQLVYKNCPEGMEVDHIHPLNEKNSCGLHVPWNLQYLTPEANRKKSNKCQT